MQLPDTVILVRKAGWKRPGSTVITGLVCAPNYIRQGYAADWDATERTNNAAIARLRADLGDREGHGTERPVIAGEGSRDEPSSSNHNKEIQTNGS